MHGSGRRKRKGMKGGGGGKRRIARKKTEAAIAIWNPNGKISNCQKVVAFEGIKQMIGMLLLYDSTVARAKA